MNAYLLLLFSSLFSYLPYILHSVYVHLTTSISLINTTCPKKVLFSYKLCITASISPTVTCHLFIFAIVFFVYNVSYKKDHVCFSDGFDSSSLFSVL